MESRDISRENVQRVWSREAEAPGATTAKDTVTLPETAPMREKKDKTSQEAATAATDRGKEARELNAITVNNTVISPETVPKVEAVATNNLVLNVTTAKTLVTSQEIVKMIEKKDMTIDN